MPGPSAAQKPFTLLVLTTYASSLATTMPAKARMLLYTPPQSTAKVLSHASREPVRKLLPPPTPALLNSRSMWSVPWRSATSSRKPCIWASFVTSARCVVTRTPGGASFSARTAVSLMLSTLTSHVATEHPSAASWITSSRPIPVPPPVTTASLPTKESTRRPYPGASPPRPEGLPPRGRAMRYTPLRLHAAGNLRRPDGRPCRSAGRVAAARGCGRAGCGRAVTASDLARRSRGTRCARHSKTSRAAFGESGRGSNVRLRRARAVYPTGAFRAVGRGHRESQASVRTDHSSRATLPLARRSRPILRTSACYGVPRSGPVAVPYALAALSGSHQPASHPVQGSTPSTPDQLRRRRLRQAIRDNRAGEDAALHDDPSVAPP